MEQQNLMTQEELMQICSRINKGDIRTALASIHALQLKGYRIVGKYLIGQYNEAPQKINKDGFPRVCKLQLLNGRFAISFNNKKTYLNRLVYEAHHGPLKLYQGVQYIDGDTTNNRLDNLEAIIWGSSKIVW